MPRLLVWTPTSNLAHLPTHSSLGVWVGAGPGPPRAPNSRGRRNLTRSPPPNTTPAHSKFKFCSGELSGTFFPKYFQPVVGGICRQCLHSPAPVEFHGPGCRPDLTEMCLCDPNTSPPRPETSHYPPTSAWGQVTLACRDLLHLGRQPGHARPRGPLRGPARALVLTRLLHSPPWPRSPTSSRPAERTNPLTSGSQASILPVASTPPQAPDHAPHPTRAPTLPCASREAPQCEGGLVQTGATRAAGLTAELLLPLPKGGLRQPWLVGTPCRVASHLN